MTDRPDQINGECPFCERRKRMAVNTAVPRMVFDCRCGATAEVKPIRHDAAKAFWAVEWTAS